MNEITVYEQPMTAVEIRSQVNLIQEVMQSVMQENQHYGIVPGCGNKPTLLKPGAEKIMATFRLSADPEVEDISTGDIIRYRIKCRLLSQSGIFKGAGLGECSSEEEKYKWRSVVSTAEWESTPEDMKRTKFKRDGTIQQIKTNSADLANTILKMAKKRALVDAVLTVTAASDIFTQDIEDMPEEIISKHKTPVTQPQPKNTTPAQAQAQTDGSIVVEATIEKVTSKIGKTGSKSWMLHGILADGIWYNTFDSKIADMAILKKGKKVTITYTQGEKGKNLISIMFEGCTGNPSTCDLSSYENEQAFCEGESKCIFAGLVSNE